MDVSEQNGGGKADSLRNKQSHHQIGSCSEPPPRLQYLGEPLTLWRCSNSRTCLNLLELSSLESQLPLESTTQMADLAAVGTVDQRLVVSESRSRMIRSRAWLFLRPPYSRVATAPGQLYPHLRRLKRLIDNRLPHQYLRHRQPPSTVGSGARSTSRRNVAKDFPLSSAIRGSTPRARMPYWYTFFCSLLFTRVKHHSHFLSLRSPLSVSFS